MKDKFRDTFGRFAWYVARNRLASKIFVLGLGIVTSLIAGELMLRLVWDLPEKGSYTRVDVADGERWLFTGGVNPTQLFYVKKPAGMKRIFIAGESTARRFDLAIFERMLKSALPKSHFEIVNIAKDGASAAMTLGMVEEVMEYSPDLLIVIVGNTEFWERRDRRYLSRRWTLRSAIAAVVDRLFIRPVPVKDNTEANRYYAESMRRIIRETKRHGVPLVVCALPVNHRTRSYRGADIYFTKEFFFAARQIEKKRYADARQNLLRLKEEVPQNAHIKLSLGLLEESVGGYDTAHDYYHAALDTTPYSTTCSPERNDLIRRLCREENIILADVDRKFTQGVPHGIPGYDLFCDNCHPFPSAYRWYTEEILDSLRAHAERTGDGVLAPREEWGAGSIKRSDYADIVKAEQKEPLMHLLAITLYDITSFSELNGRERYSFTPEAVHYLRQVYFSHPQYARQLKNVGTEILSFYNGKPWATHIPSDERDKAWASVLFHLGEMFRQVGEEELALDSFSESIRLNPRAFEPYVFRGLVYQDRRRKKEAEKDFNEAIKVNPSLEWLSELQPDLARL